MLRWNSAGALRELRIEKAQNVEWQERLKDG
jgi:hypothetical protein